MILFLSNNEVSRPLYKWLQDQQEEIIWIEEKISIDKIKEMSPSLIINYNYRYIIGEDIIEYMGDRIINLHISYLPWNRGADPNFWSFIDDSPKGVTIHLLDKGLDKGDIIVQKEYFFNEDKETFATAYEYLHRKIVELFIESWERIKSGNYIVRKQQGKGSYHSHKQFVEIVNNIDFSWNSNICDIKKQIDNIKNN